MQWKKKTQSLNPQSLSLTKAHNKMTKMQNSDTQKNNS